MKKNETKQEKKSVDMVVKGVALYPEYKDGVFSMKMLVDEKTAEKIENEIIDLDGQLTVSDEEWNDTEYTGFNVKTQFSVPIYDRSGNTLTDDDFEIYFGAEILANVRFKSVPYKRKMYVAGYLLGACVLTQGENATQSCTFDDFKDALENEVEAF